MPELDSVSVRAFACFLPKDLMDAWSQSGKKHLIGPVELYGVCLARCLWKDHILDRAIFFIDHGGVLAAMISGSSRDSTWRQILLKLEECDATNHCLPWYARVPSPSNLSDGPSRGEWSILDNCEYVRDHPRCLFLDVPLVPT